MQPRLADVRHLGDYRLELGFTNGTRGEVDLRERVVGRSGVFAPLGDVQFFAEVAVDRAAGTIFWPNWVDLCPDALYQLATDNQAGVPTT